MCTVFVCVCGPAESGHYPSPSHRCAWNHPAWRLASLLAQKQKVSKRSLSSTLCVNCGICVART